MKERLLHFIWEHRRINVGRLKTTTGEEVIILDQGKHNNHSGPDFLGAKLVIGGILWAGNVEIHVKSSDWYSHLHQEDPVYENVILHVVWEDNRNIQYKSGKRIPCVELKKYVDHNLLVKFYRLQNTIDWTPCQSFIKELPDEIRTSWLDQLSLERLNDKAEKVLLKLDESKGEWETVFYEMFARNLGLHVNGDAFENLAKRTPLKILARHKDQLFQLEAILFGQSGLLSSNFKEEYPLRLWKEYEHLSKKYGLYPMPGHLWKFMRLRPINFPTIRIAQLAKIIHQSDHLFSKALSVKNLKEIVNMFDVSPGYYWKDHYRFEKKTQKINRRMGRSTHELLVINTICPILYAYGKSRGMEEVKERAIEFLQGLKPEANFLIRKWKELGWEVENSLETQALIQLRQQYCEKKLCTECKIGHWILD